MTPLVLLILAAAFSIDPLAAWSSIGKDGGPRVTALKEGGWRFAFAQGTSPEAGYAQLPVDGDRLAAANVNAFEFEGSASGAPLDFVLVYADSAARIPLKFGRPIEIPRTERRIRFIRVESPPSGLRSPAQVDLRTIRALADDAPGDAGERALRSRAAPTPRFADEAYVPFGVFILGGNRSLFEHFSMAGANASVEYGSVHWPLAVATDHVDRAAATGVRVALSVTSEREKKVTDESRRLAPALARPGALAAYTVDEPDGGSRRGLPAQACNPQALGAIRGSLEKSGVPVLLTCVDTFGLSKYAATADFLSTDPYLPAYGPSRPFTEVFAAAASVVEIASRTNATPFIVLQLEDPQWPAPKQQQTRESLRAQTYASIAAGVRGLLYWQGSAPLRRSQEGMNADGMWPAFLDLAGEVATLAPAISRWTPIAGAPEITPAMGEVRAQAFADGDETWIVLVNLGRAAAELTLGGAILADAVALEEPATKWKGEVRGGAWKGTLAPMEAHAARVVPRNPAGPRSTRIVGAFPVGEIGVDGGVAGCALDPAPAGDVKIAVDGTDRSNLRTFRGAAAVLRVPFGEVSAGSHRVTVTWTEGGAPRESTWTFTVAERARMAKLPIAEDFGASSLDENRWAVVEEVLWDVHGQEKTSARGTAKIEKGELHLQSTGGPFGVVLRGAEAPAAFRMEWTARMPRAGTLVVNRNELLRRIPVPAGKHRIALRETPGSVVIAVDGKDAARFEPPIDHQGGAIGLGVAAGGEAWIDDVRVVAGT